MAPTAWAAPPIGPNDGMLVVIGMFGGNDGLNTLVPFDDPLLLRKHRRAWRSRASQRLRDRRLGLGSATRR